MNSGHSKRLSGELHEAEATMDRALAEACDVAKPASESDTGDLIRVEELLSVASDAAKRAVSLRRRRRVDGNRVQAALAYAEAAARLATAHRTVTDMAGVRWDVFDVRPQAHPALTHEHLEGDYERGWLCFNAGPETRRLAPIPEHWRALADDELAQLAGRAELAVRERRRSAKSPDADAQPPDNR